VKATYDPTGYPTSGVFVGVNTVLGGTVFKPQS
jgi:hypothetical protein